MYKSFCTEANEANEEPASQTAVRPGRLELLFVSFLSFFKGAFAYPLGTAAHPEASIRASASRQEAGEWKSQQEEQENGLLVSSRPAFTDAVKDPQAVSKAVIKRILVPTDFSRASAKALELAVSIANQWSARLTLLHVIDISAQPSAAQFVSGQQFMQRLWDQAGVEMRHLAWSLKARVAAETALEEGLPWEEIVNRSRDFDLVVLSKRAKHSRTVFSSDTTTRVIQGARCPVMLVREKHNFPEKQGTN